jgi:hypothetical protein
MQNKEGVSDPPPAKREKLAQKQVGNGFVGPNSMPAGMMLHTALKKTWS